ncbi:lysis system i-spanin subunit Rz [Xenorhabdus sp. SF857]|uniref:lysis system i-spanin subunit Rz n=1 Tax=Xenorhabdus bakwenae TaxID=3026967 RepID=UPI002557CBA0|nr:lysis system i-spanin subunit Rz [Xenorhabdus sp. SF857]WFQ80740.1 lysis system i-spanin subunit Rz [Xenorhabdus sp. SF857]
MGSLLQQSNDWEHDPETAAPSGVDGSRPARLAKDAEQDYVRLLGELETLEAQFLGLRDWAKTECGRNNGKR